MKKDKSKTTCAENNLPLAEMSLKELLSEWGRQRKEHYLVLKANGLRNSDIAKMYGITRQAVGLVLNK